MRGSQKWLQTLQISLVSFFFFSTSFSTLEGFSSVPFSSFPVLPRKRSFYYLLMEKIKLEGLLEGCFEAVHLTCPLKLLSVPRSRRQTFNVAFSLFNPKLLCLCPTWSLPWLSFQLRTVEEVGLEHRRLCFCSWSRRSHRGYVEQPLIWSTSLR